MGGTYNFLIIVLIGQGAEEQLVYMVGQLLGLIISGFVLYNIWNWLYLNLHKERSIGRKIIYGLVMSLCIIFTAAIAFVAYYYSPAFALPLAVVIILGFVKSRQYKRLEKEKETDESTNLGLENPLKSE